MDIPAGLSLVTAPVYEPISLADAKDHMRVTINADDADILQMIKAARARLESITNRALITQTWEWTLDNFPGWCLHPPKAPLQSVSSIVYLDTDGNSTTLASTEYITDTKSHRPRITPAFSKSWPSVRQQLNAITITIVVGYGNPPDIPKPLNHAMKMLVGHYYENREAISDFQQYEVPMGVYDLVADYRIHNF